MTQELHSLVTAQFDSAITDVPVKPGKDYDENLPSEDYNDNLFSEDCNGNLFSVDYETTNSKLAVRTAEESNMG